jgi:phosphoribosyl-ATP pyrophosphohydrolase/phosphoribosyl-AMP cyclohydrolase/histidinol dehydrogenase
LADDIAPEHLHIVTRDADTLGERVRCYGSLFIGAHTPEALGDYGIGPNHVLPTGGAARHATGLSVLTFLRARTFARIDAPRSAQSEYARTASVATLEGLAGHARSAQLRLLPRATDRAQ